MEKRAAIWIFFIILTRNIFININQIRILIDL